MRANYASLTPIFEAATPFEVAMAAAKLGIPVLPCNPESKAPYIKRGYLDASCDPARVQTWWESYPAAMVGIRLGGISGLSVIDLDIKPDKDGVANFKAICKEAKLEFPLSQMVARSPSGGYHLYFEHIRSSSKTFG